MQPIASDYRTIVQWRRVEPDGDDNGDAVPEFVRQEDSIQAGFVPASSARSMSDAGIDVSEVRWKVFVGGPSHPFAVGDRLGPSASTEPDMEVVSVLDFPTIQNLEVRLL